VTLRISIGCFTDSEGEPHSCIEPESTCIRVHLSQMVMTSPAAQLYPHHSQSRGTCNRCAGRNRPREVAVGNTNQDRLSSKFRKFCLATPIGSSVKAKRLPCPLTFADCSAMRIGSRLCVGRIQPIPHKLTIMALCRSKLLQHRPLIPQPRLA